MPPIQKGRCTDSIRSKQSKSSSLVRVLIEVIRIRKSGIDRDYFLRYSYDSSTCSFWTESFITDKIARLAPIISADDVTIPLINTRRVLESKQIILIHELI